MRVNDEVVDASSKKKMLF